MLCGNLHPFPLAVWHNYSAGPDTAEDYYATYSPLWGQYPEALLFVNWLYNHSSVLHERAEIIKCAEMLMQEDDFEICESILRQQEKLRERIDETLSEKIVQKCRNMNGEYVWPGYCRFQQQAGNILAYSISRYRISVSCTQVIIYPPIITLLMSLSRLSAGVIF